MSTHWESCREVQSKYKKAVRSAKIKSKREFCESVNKIPEPTGVRKILAKYRATTEKPLENPVGGLAKTSNEAVAVLLDAHFSGAKIISGPEMKPKPLYFPTLKIYQKNSQKYFASSLPKMFPQLPQKVLRTSKIFLTFFKFCPILLIFF